MNNISSMQSNNSAGKSDNSVRIKKEIIDTSPDTVSISYRSDEIDRTGSNFLKNLKNLHFDVDSGHSADKVSVKEKVKHKLSELLDKGAVNPDNCEHVVKFDELLNSGSIKPGDIILVGEPLNPVMKGITALIPGEYTHVLLYTGKNEKGEHKSLEAWYPEVQIRDARWCAKKWNKWAVVRPHDSKGMELDQEERQKVVDFAKSTEGCHYNMKWFKNKVKLPVDKEESKFYCSQLAWAAYYYTSGIDIDKNPDFKMKYACGVAPQEIYDSPEVSVIAKSE